MFFVRNLTLVRADISRLPFVSSSVDAVHAGAALHCWPSPSTAVSISSIHGFEVNFSYCRGFPQIFFHLLILHTALYWKTIPLDQMDPSCPKGRFIYMLFSFVWNFFNFMFISIFLWNSLLELSGLHFLLHISCVLLCY